MKLSNRWCTCIPGDIYRKVAIGCLDVIHKQNADRLVIADGNHGGSLVIPEITDFSTPYSLYRLSGVFN